MRPLNLGETLDAAMKIVRRRWRTLAAVMVVVALPIQLLDLLVVTTTTDTYQVGSGTFASTSAASKTTYSDEGVYVGGQVVIQLLGLIGVLLGTVACYRAVADTYLGTETGAADSLRFAARRAGPTLWLALLLVLGLALAFLALFVPFVWLGIAWSVAYPVMLVEGQGGAAALRRSFGLVQDRWWATLGRLLVAYILVSVVSVAATAALLIPATALLDDTSFGALLVDHTANFIVSLLTTPFIAAVTMLVYFDLRARKEGFDVAMLADGLGGAPGAAAAPPPPTYSGGWAPPLAPPPRRPPSSS